MPGSYEVIFDASAAPQAGRESGSVHSTLPSGMYLYRLMVSYGVPLGSRIFQQTKKFILLR